MKRYDDIEQLFRQRLRDEDPESGDWLTPPQFILDNAAKIVNERKKKRRRGFIILFFGLSAIGIISMHVLGWNSNTPSLDVALAQNDNSIVVITKKTDQARSLSAKKDMEHSTGHTSTRNNRDELYATQENSITDIELIQEQEDPRVSTNNSTNSKFNSDDQLQLSAIDNESDKRGIDQKTSKAEQDHIMQIRSIGSRGLDWERPTVINDQQYAVSKPDYTQRGLGFYAFGGTNLSTLQMTNVPELDFELREYDNYYLGYQFGLGSDYIIDQRWSVVAEISFNSYLNKSSFLSNELYDKAKEEEQSDGSITYRSSFDISSPLSDTSNEFIIDLDDNTVEQDHILVNSTEIKERINVLKSSIGIRYELFQLEKLSIGMSSGISANTIFNLNNLFRSTVSYEDVKMMEKEFKSDEMNMLNRLYLSAYVSAGVDYRYNSNWSAFMNGGYERSIGSIRKQNASSMTKTMLGSIHLNVGLRHLF